MTTQQQTIKTPWQRANTDWMRDAHWGVMTHYMADLPSSKEPADMTPERWNRHVDGFDVPRLVETIAGTGAGYLIFTIGQCSGYLPHADRHSILSPPNPEPELWEEDFRQIAELGFSLVRCWLYWRVVEPHEEKWTWEEYDHSTELAGKHRLKAVLQLVPESQPE